MLSFLENPFTSIPALLKSLVKCSIVSGYKVSTNKSEGMIITGDWPAQLEKLPLSQDLSSNSDTLVMCLHKIYLAKSETKNPVENINGNKRKRRST